MIAIQRKIIHKAIEMDCFPHWLYDHSVVSTSEGKVYRLGKWVIFIDNHGLPSVADVESVKLEIAKIVYKEVRVS